MDEVDRLPAHEVRRRLRSDAGTLLVCAYEGEVGFRKYPLPGAIALSELRERLAGLPRDAEIVLYCRCPEDRTAVRRARELLDLGFPNVKVLAGGHAAW
jgi:rhodanese-related sulfurtransferase